jgi:hypothetical protein
MKDHEKQDSTELSGVQAQLEPTKQMQKEMGQLQAEIEDLRRQLQVLSHKPSTRIGAAFTVPGLLSLFLSIVTESQVLAFVGLSLIFWGILFLFASPASYVKGSLLPLTVASIYSTIDRVIKDLDCKGKGIYVPPSSKELRLPEQFEGLKDTIVFVSADAASNLPSIEGIAGRKFLSTNPKGIILVPPGLYLSNKFEEALRTEPATMSVEDLCVTLPRLIKENWEPAKEVTMHVDGEKVILMTSDSLYRDLYSKESLKSVRLIGDPLTSAVACVLARASGKRVSIESLNVSPDARTMEVHFRMFGDN